MQARAEPSVVEWLNGQQPDDVWTTSISLMEVRFGLELLRSTVRRRKLQAAFERAISEKMGARVLPFDEEAALAAAHHAAVRRAAGRPVDFRDLEIAGIAASRRAALATRNANHFLGLGIEVVNPWNAR